MKAVYKSKAWQTVLQDEPRTESWNNSLGSLYCQAKGVCTQ